MNISSLIPGVLFIGSIALAQDAGPAASTSPDKAAVDEARFKKYDKDNDGSISLDEYIKGMGNEEKAKKLFSTRDKNSDGKLSFEEFTNSPIPLAKDASPAASASPEKNPADEARFKKYDKDNDGSISLDEYIQGMGNEEKAKKLFSSRDKNNDGKLSFEEFTSGKKSGQ